MIYTVGDILPFVAKKVDGAGVDYRCSPGREQAFEAYNRISRLLALEGDWVGTEAEVCFPIRCGSIVTDYRIARINRAKVCGGDLDVHARAYQFNAAGPGHPEDNRTGINWLQDQGVSAVAVQPTVPANIIAVSDRPEAEDTAIVILGDDAAGNTIYQDGTPGAKTLIREALSDPVYTDGDDYYDGRVKRITGIRKGATNGRVDIYAYLSPLHIEWLASMDPGQTHTSYRHYRLAGVDSCCSNGHVLGWVTLDTVPASHEDDIAIIQQPDAYERMAQALGYFDDGDINRYMQFKNAAVSTLHKHYRHRNGDAKHPLKVSMTRAPATLSTGTSRDTFFFRRHRR